MRTIMILGLAATAACGKGDGDDWSKRAVKPVSATTDGVAFTIDLPDGMRQKTDGKDVTFDFLVGEYAKTPTFTIGTGAFAKSLDEYQKSQPDVATYLRKETLADGGYIASNENTSYKGREDYLVYVYRPVGDKALTCSARVTPWTKGAKVKDKVPLVEKACLSLRPSK